MSETIKLCAMVVRAVFDGDSDDVREPYVKQAIRARDEYDAMKSTVARLQSERDAAVAEALCARDLRKLLDAADARVTELEAQDAWILALVERWQVEADEAESIAALAMREGLAECERERAANDDLLRRILTLMDACDATHADADAARFLSAGWKRLAKLNGAACDEASAKFRRAQVVVEAARAYSGFDAIGDALAGYDAKGGRRCLNGESVRDTTA